MTEVHVRTYTEHHDTVRCYDPRRYTWRELPRRRTVADTQAVEFDDREPVTPWETRNMRAERLRAENTERIRALLREHGPHTRQAIQAALNLTRMMAEKLVAAEIERGNMQRVGWYHRFRVFGLVGQVFEPPHEYERHGLTILDVLRGNGEMKVSQIVAATGLQHSNVQRLLKLYEGDLFERTVVGGNRTAAVWVARGQENT